MRAILIILILMLAVSPSEAQQFYGGVKGGITISQIDGDLYGGFHKYGFFGSVQAGKEIRQNLNWQVEVKYVLRGMNVPRDPLNPSIYTETYFYFEIPVSLNYTFREKFMPEAGISPDIFTHMVIQDDGGLVPSSVYPEVHRFGINVFAGFYYWLSEKVAVGGRYTYSALTFKDREEWQVYPFHPGYFHNVISLSVTYRFPF